MKINRANLKNSSFLIYEVLTMDVYEDDKNREKSVEERLSEIEKFIEIQDDEGITVRHMNID